MSRPRWIAFVLRKGWRRRLTLSVLALIIVASVGLGYYASLPNVADAPKRVAAILAAHHVASERGRLPAKLSTAVVATEDEHFYANVVYDATAGVGRAAVAFLEGSRDPGGSTIAQQLAKQLYGGGTGWTATARDLLLGVKLSLGFPKDEILRMYLEASYFGHGYWGAQAAAAGYFGVTPARLTWAQASLLAGLLQAPSAYDPLRHFALAKQRQREVLDQLVANHDLTAAQASSVFRQGLALAIHSSPVEGKAAVRIDAGGADQDQALRAATYFSGFLR